jgi:hypothetical protein
MERLIGTWRSHRRDNPDLLATELVMLCFPCCWPLLCCALFSKRELTIEKHGNFWTMSGIEVAFELDKPFIITVCNDPEKEWDKTNYLITMSWANNQLQKVTKFKDGSECLTSYRINDNDQLEVRTESYLYTDTQIYKRI